MKLSISAIIIAHVAVFAWTGTARAAPFTLSGEANILVIRSLNDVGIVQGEIDEFGANVGPINSAGTTISGSQNGFTTTTVGCQPVSTNAQQCLRDVAVNSSFQPSLTGPALTGAWNMTFRNGNNVQTVASPTLGTPAVVPFPVNVSITNSGGGSTPTFNWTFGNGFQPDTFGGLIFDRGNFLPNGTANTVNFSQLAPNATSFTVPTQLSDGGTLLLNHPYTLALQTIVTRDGTSNIGVGTSNELVRSVSYFDFTVSSSNQPPNVLLPQVSGGPNPVYHFHQTGITQGQEIFVDPQIAIGYDYATGAGDPNFASVTLPTIQSNDYDLSFVLNSQQVDELVAPGAQVFFGGDGVSAFSVRDIDVADNLDPTNVNAFVTGLTFVSPGDFTGTMTPITEDVAATVPEPGTLALMTAGLIGLGVALRRRTYRTCGRSPGLPEGARKYKKGLLQAHFQRGAKFFTSGIDDLFQAYRGSQS